MSWRFVNWIPYTGTPVKVVAIYTVSKIFYSSGSREVVVVVVVVVIIASERESKPAVRRGGGWEKTAGKARNRRPGDAHARTSRRLHVRSGARRRRRYDPLRRRRRRRRTGRLWRTSTTVVLRVVVCCVQQCAPQRDRIYRRYAYSYTRQSDSAHRTTTTKRTHVVPRHGGAREKRTVPITNRLVTCKTSFKKF